MNTPTTPKPRKKPIASDAGPTVPRGTIRKNRIVGHALVDPRTLLAHPDNWRIHPDHQRAILRGSLDDLGWTKSVLVQQSKGLIVDGHARVLIAVHDGEAEVPVEYVDLTDAEVIKALAALDPISSLADIDFRALEKTLGQIDGPDPGLAALYDELEAQVADALAMERQYEGRTETNFNSVQKSFSERKVVIKAVYALDEAELVERALEATGKINRAEAMQMLARHFLETHNHHDRHPTDKLDRHPEDRAAQDVAEALGRSAAIHD
jgi:hypothetical protein